MNFVVVKKSLQALDLALPFPSRSACSKTREDSLAVNCPDLHIPDSSSFLTNRDKRLGR